jgi:hypothetical protein
MERIRFDRLWKKLTERKIGDLVITIRRSTPEKLDFYESNIGKEFLIEVSGGKNGFRGFNLNTEYIVLIFQVTEIIEEKITKLKLLDLFVSEGNMLSEPLKQYDTEE